jgi:hypothetical protein
MIDLDTIFEESDDRNEFSLLFRVAESCIWNDERRALAILKHLYKAASYAAEGNEEAREAAFRSLQKAYLAIDT